MKRVVLTACLLALAVLSALAEAEFCFSRENAPYWHRDRECDYAETGWMESEALGAETRCIEARQAETEGQKPCPGCATAFAPTFTGDFPDWPYETAPWGYERVDGVADGFSKAWGAPVERLYALFPDGDDFENGGSDYPDDYAGVFMNACGSCTILLVNPSPERVARWQAMLRGEFWVLSARYSYNELKTLAKLVSSKIIEADNERMKRGEAAYYHIVSVGVDVISNAVEIGVTPDGFSEGVQRIRGALAEEGYSDSCIVRFVSANYPSWM